MPRAPALRFTGWCLWYGKATGHWWALSPTWCRERIGLIEADTPAELAAQIRHIEDFHLHLTSDQPKRPPRPLPRADAQAPQPEGPDGENGPDIRVAGTIRLNRIEGKGGDRDGSATPVRTRRRTR
ncbi:hypothetical protein [Streptosporangium sp. NBC_01469]|uniref:hypothetical protein n=1 Tax=Streptosporangium sp. NBC_01469 TaxID=2903898 RepID=UPI002E2DBFC5|nr:hypothetical protein [Streptosporangium sp. NBC_01469]